MIIYEGTNNLVSGAFLKCFSIHSQGLVRNTMVRIVTMILEYCIQSDHFSCESY